MYTLKRFTALLIVSVMLCAVGVVSVFAEEIESRVAPVSPEFLKWQEEQNNVDTHSDSDNPEDGSIHMFPTGDRPDPIDLSHLSKNLPRENSDSNHPKDGDTPIPAKYDLRDQGRVPPVRDQGNYETCWSFAALAACESNYMSQNLSFLNGTPDLSELHMAWFAYKDPVEGNSFFYDLSQCTCA